MNFDEIVSLLGDQAEYLLAHECHTIAKERLTLPNPDFVDQIFKNSDRNNNTLQHLQWLFSKGRLAHTGYISILPIDQGIEHSAGQTFAANPDYFDPENIIKLAIEGGCSAITSSLGVLGLTSRKYAHKIPYILKINHNELLTYPNKHDEILFASVDQAWEMGAVGVGATIYFGSKESNRQIQEISQAFHLAHQRGMFTILWCYLRNPGFTKDGVDYHTSTDITSQALHLAASIEADIVKQKLPTNNRAFQNINFGKWDERMYSTLCSDHPIDMVRYQVANAYMGKIGLINSGGGSSDNDLFAAVKTAVINKRGGGMGLIMGRKAFQKPLLEGIKIINAVQDVYLERKITIA